MDLHLNYVSEFTGGFSTMIKSRRVVVIYLYCPRVVYFCFKLCKIVHDYIIQFFWNNGKIQPKR